MKTFLQSDAFANNVLPIVVVIIGIVRTIVVFTS
jgi:hypothetical protein